MKLYELHAHTSEISACGRLSARDLVYMYKQAGFDGLVVTDHMNAEQRFHKNHTIPRARMDAFLEGYRQARRFGQAVGLNVLLGFEIRFPDGDEDYLVYGADECWLANHADCYMTDLARFRDMTRDQGILIVQAHPFRAGLRAADPRLLDGVEGYNRNPRHNSANDRALAYARRNGLAVCTAGSDAHRTEDVGRGGMWVPEGITDSSGLAAALREGKCRVAACTFE